MSKRERKQQRKRRLTRKREKRLQEIEILLGGRSALDAELEVIAERAERKGKRNPKDAERRAKIESDIERLEEDLAERSEEIKALSREIKRLRKWRTRAKHRIAKLARQIRNLARPKVKVLDLDFRSGMASQGAITATIGHHTAGPTDDNDAEAEDLWQRYHAQHLAQGWSGEGYHYGLSREGTIYILRPVAYAGAHTAGANTGHPGFVCHGTTGDRPTRAQRRAYRYALKKAHTTRFPSRGRASRRLLDVPATGHNDWNATACPGTHKPMYTSQGKRR